jgi:uroporphyrinogen III methyltransferase/synthase
MGKVYLVGAGPGDAGLITVRGLEKLKECDAVVYDRLAGEELLDYVRPGCTKIYVGKETSKHYKKQEAINEILVDCGKKYPVVVRLKGGDPFVFGRGGEEIEALTQAEIPYEVIPGVTSAVAVPECAGIPVTHRGVSRSFHVITGHTKTSVGSPDYDYESLAKLEGTLVFLMGLANLSDLAERLMQAGKAGETPAAVISNGTLETQRTVRGTLQDIADRVRESQISSPAVIVIGATAEYEYRYPCLSSTGREGKTGGYVGVTATDLLWRKLKCGLEEMGMHPVPLCNMKVVPTEQMEELGEELRHLEAYRWVLFTSQNAVQLFWEKLRQEEVDIRRLRNLRFGALGSGTAARLKDYGIQADFVPSHYTISVMAQEFVRLVQPGERVLIPRAVQGSPELAEILDRHNISYKEIPIYDVTGRMTENIRYLEKLDYLVFVSASGVSAFFEELQRSGLEMPRGIKIACIGDATEKRLRREYMAADVVAAVNNVSGLLDAVRRHKEENREENKEENREENKEEN